jgi:hypothetical protein
MELEDGGSFEEDDNQPIDEDCSIDPHALEQPNGEYSEGGESSYGYGDDYGSDLASSAPAACTKKRQKTSSWANGAKVQAAEVKTKKAVAGLNQLKKIHAKLTKMHEALDSNGSSLDMSSAGFSPRVTPTDFLSLIRPTADRAEIARMTIIGRIQGSFVDVGGHHGNAGHLPPQLQHQYNPAQHQFKLNMALQAKAGAENELILLKNKMSMLPMNNGFFQRPGQSMQPLGWMSLPGQHVQHPQQQQEWPQFMQPLGGMSLPGQHA